MDITPKGKKPMSKGEVGVLLELIQNYPIITSKETNAAANKLKEDAWCSLTAAFNAKCGRLPRQKEQLKMKWDNLKKRSQQIHMNNLKTNGEKPDFIPPDENLDKVASALGATCSFELQHFDNVDTVQLPDNAAPDKIEVDDIGHFRIHTAALGSADIRFAGKLYDYAGR